MTPHAPNRTPYQLRSRTEVKPVSVKSPRATSRRFWPLLLLAVATVTVIAIFAELRVLALNLEIESQSLDLAALAENHFRRMTDWPSSVADDPRSAALLISEARQFGIAHDLTPARLDQLAITLPVAVSLNENTRITIRHHDFLTPIVTVDVSVVDGSGAFIEGLSRVDFEVKNGEFRLHHVQVAKAFRSTSELSVAMLLDCSKSMTGEPIDFAKQAVSEFSQTFAGPARLQLWKFSDSASKLTPLTIDAQIIVEALTQIVLENGTNLYATVMQAAEALGQRDTERAILLLTDGKDSFKTMTPADVTALCIRHRVAVHVIALAHGDAEEPILRGLATETGGSFQTTHDAASTSAAFKQIADDLKEPVYRIVVLEPFDISVPLILEVDGLTPVPLTNQQ